MKIIRTTTVPGSLNSFCNGLLRELHEVDGYDVVALSSPGEALDEIRIREQVRTIAVPMERHISLVKDFVSLVRLIIVFHKEKPTIVHSMTPKAGLLSMMAAWCCRVPIRVHTFTGLVFPTASGLIQKVLIFTDRLTCACATHIVPEGNGVKEDLISYKITDKRLNVLGHGNVRGIDLDHYNPTLPYVQEAAAKIRKDGVITFIFVGRLVKSKGINELIDAFTKLNVQYSRTRLLLVGPYEENLDPLEPEALAEIENNNAIEAVGPQKDVRPWLAASDVFVFPSYREGFPNVVIEAGAMGLPSIVTDINGSREIIIDGKNGIIIPPRQSEILRQAMGIFVKDADLARNLSRDARSLIASRYEQGFVRQCLKDYYKGILKDLD